MIRIAHISDSHFDERKRLADVDKIHEEFLKQAREAGVDLIVHAGDFYERKSQPLERLALAAFLHDASRVAPFFGVKGNHDAEDDLGIFNHLGRRGHFSMIAEKPSQERIVLANKPAVWCFGIPWFDKAYLLANLEVADQEMARAVTIREAARMLNAVKGQIAAAKLTGAITIVVGHLLVAGSEVSSGQTLLGTTVELAPHILNELGASYVALGHVHKAQEWHGGRVAYSGSPHRCNFGEPEPKGWRLVSIEDDGTFISNEFRELPTRAMVFLDYDWTKGVPEFVPFHETPGVGGALVRVRIHIRPEDVGNVGEDLIRRALLGAGASQVQIEPIVETQTRARSPEIARAQSVLDKLQVYMESKGIEREPAFMDRLHGKLVQIGGME